MSGSRVDIPDEELADEWPFLTRQQLEEYKDAFRIFDRSGLGSFTAEDVDWVMRSLGQSPTQQQIDAIIRDMDLDNDGVIDLAEFMVRMMALTTKTAPEEDLKHVFDVLDKSGEGMITADSLRTAIKNIAEWEMTDQDIEVAIKLADKSGDGRIDYDEFIAFVFGGDEPVQRLQHTGTNSVHPEPQASEIQSATSHIPPQILLLPADGIHSPADAPQLPADGLEMPAGSLQLQTDASQVPAEPYQKPSDSCSDGDPAPSTRTAPQHQSPFSSPALQQTDDPDLSVQQQSMTDRWVASQTEAVTQPAGEQAATLATFTHNNALYQADEQSNIQSGAAGDHWHAEHQHARQPPQLSSDQPGDDVRLRIQSDDTEPNQSQLVASHYSGGDDDDDRFVSSSVYSGVHGDHASQGSQHQVAFSSQTHPSFQHNMQRATETSDLPSTIDDDREEGRPSSSSSEGQLGCVSEPGGLQAAWHGDAIHLSLPPEVAVQTTEYPSQSGLSPSASFAKPGHAQQAHSAGSPARFTRVLSKPRKLPPLSRAQLSQGVNRSRVGQQQLDGLAHTP